MKKLFLFLLLSFSITMFSQKVKDSVLSRKMDKYRDLSVSVPASYSKDSKKTYPLIVLLDGDYLFDAFEGAIKYGNYWDDLPEVIIVGLHQNEDDERFEDCTMDATTGLPEGKGEKFFEFIGGELLPYIQSKYRVGNFKAIAGHDITAGYINLFLYKDIP
ncbi:alpha/beta hydrolase, partial [Flavobacterium sp.]|uniref:alpha/beta hydrolase n=1 Tax=Flavobacterium sp. TaxID=239 RepID=UPI003753CCDE